MLQCVAVCCSGLSLIAMVGHVVFPLIAICRHVVFLSPTAPSLKAALKVLRSASDSFRFVLFT